MVMLSYDRFTSMRPFILGKNPLSPEAQNLKIDLKYTKETRMDNKSNSPDQTIENKFYYGWYIVGAGAISNLFTIGILAWGLGIFVEEFRSEFGWSIKAIALGFSIRSFETGLLSPFTGYLIDRIGARKATILGTSLMAAGLFLFSQVNSLSSYYIASATLALGQSVGGLPSFTRALINWFQQKRGQAIGLMNTGNALGYFAPLVMASLLAAVGWRETLFISGTVIFVIGVPLAFVVRDRPKLSDTLVTDSSMESSDLEQPNSKSESVPVIRTDADSGLTVREALRVPAFYLMLLAAGVEGFSHGPWVTFNIPHMQTSGFSLQGATTIIGVYGLLQVVLRYAVGVLSDRIGRRRIYISSYLFQTVGIISFAFLSPGRMWLSPIYLITQGISHAAMVIGRDSIVADYFGTKRYSTIRGLRQALLLPATFLAPLFMGALFDIRGSYRLGYIIVAIIGATGSIWLSLIRRSQWETPQRGN